MGGGHDWKSENEKKSQLLWFYFVGAAVSYTCLLLMCKYVLGKKKTNYEILSNSLLSKYKTNRNQLININLTCA